MITIQLQSRTLKLREETIKNLATFKNSFFYVYRHIESENVRNAAILRDYKAIHQELKKQEY